MRDKHDDFADRLARGATWVVYRNGECLGKCFARDQAEAIRIGKARRGDRPGDTWTARAVEARHA